jgi:poly-gamma-glutamate synthase PgsB/CapB
LTCERIPKARRTPIKGILVTGVVVLVFLVYLVIERLILSGRISRIPLRICVTGTRGKSSVTRLITACLRESGMSVLAKTTGSRPCLIYPDGSESEIKRRGNPSILEGRRMLKVGKAKKAQALVSEMMSVRCESLHSEVVQVFKPHILVITNVRADHLAEMGPAREDIVRCFAFGIPRKCTVFIPQEELDPLFLQRAGKVHSRVVQVREDSLAGLEKSREKIPAHEFGQNVRLALAVAEFLGIEEKIAFPAVSGVFPDLGSLKAWEKICGTPPAPWLFVSAFAANDPESTKRVLDKLESRGLFKGRKKIGLLNLRSDRGDRTIQWLKALVDEDRFSFHRLFLIGHHAALLKKKIKHQTGAASAVIKAKGPEELIAQITRLEKGPCVLVGLGNIAGMGRALVEHWEGKAKPYAI